MNLKIKQSLAGFALLLLSYALAYVYIHWSPREYIVRHNLQGIRVVSNGKESFVEVAVGEQDLSTLKWSKYAPSLQRVLGLSAPLQYFWNSQTHVWHCQDGQASRVDLPGPYGLQDVSIVGGKLTWTDASRNARQWDGKGFQPIASPSTGTGSSATDSDEVDEDSDLAVNQQNSELKKAGWKVLYLRISKAGLLTLPVGDIRVEDEHVDSLTGNLNEYGLSERLTRHTLRIYQSGASNPTPLASETITNAPAEIDALSFQNRAGFGKTVGLQRNNDVTRALNVGRILIWPLLLFSLPFLSKSALKQNVPANFTYMPAQRAQFPKLEVMTLDNYSRELEARGFELLFEGTVTPGKGMIIPGFTRVLAHKRLLVFAEVYQAFPPIGRVLPVGCGINAYFDQDWSLSVGNSKPMKANIFTRLPRSVSFSLPGASPSELLQKHQELRQQLVVDLGIRELPDMSMDAYIRYSQRKNELRAEERGKRFLSKYLRYHFAGKLSAEWRGDWPKEAKKTSRRVRIGVWCFCQPLAVS